MKTYCPDFMVGLIEKEGILERPTLTLTTRLSTASIVRVQIMVLVIFAPFSNATPGTVRFATSIPQMRGQNTLALMKTAC